MKPIVLSIEPLLLLAAPANHPALMAKVRPRPARWIGFSNALFLADRTSNTAPDALESVLGVGCDLLSVDGAAEMRRQ